MQHGPISQKKRLSQAEMSLETEFINILTEIFKALFPFQPVKNWLQRKQF